MRIAICISGEIRTGVESFPNIKLFLENVFPYCDFFIHTWNQNTDKHYIDNYEIKTSYVSEETIEKIKDFYNPKKIIIEEHLPFNNEISPIDNIITYPLYYSWEKTIQYKKQYEIDNNFIYDYVCKIRFDLIYNPSIKLDHFLSKVKPNYFCVDLTWINNGQITVNDTFFLCDSETMDRAVKINKYSFDIIDEDFSEIEMSGFNNVFARYLMLNGFYLYSLNMFKDISVYRPRCLQYSPLIEFEKCDECNQINHWGMKTLKHITIEELERDFNLYVSKNLHIPNNIIKLIKKT